MKKMMWEKLGLLSRGAAVFLVFGLWIFSAANLVSDDSSPAPVRGEDALDAVATAVSSGNLSLKDSVILRAKLLFDPNAELSVSENSILAKTGSKCNDPCSTSFYKDLHRVFGELNKDEEAYLSSVSPDAAVIISTREAEAEGISSGKGALPVFPKLTEVVEGKNCIVHYSLTDPTDKVPDQNYADLVAVYMDMAIKNIPKKKFNAALPEGGGKLHVYVYFLGAGTWGQWVDVSAGTGKTKSGYIEITSRMSTEAPKATWQLYLKSCCFHEYFHGVQSAYNWASSLWFMEGCCRWSEIYFCKNTDPIKESFASTISVFNAPQLPIWDNSYHKYTTVTLAYYFYDNFGGVKFLLDFYKKTEAKDDAITIFQDMMVENKTTFSDTFKKYLAAMYNKKISSIKKLMIDVKKTEINTYGNKGTESSLYQLGSVNYKLTPQADIPSASFIYGFVPGAAGAPEAFMLQKSKIIPVVGGAANYECIAKFGKSAKEIIMIATDTTYSGVQDVAARSYDYEFLTPYVKITDTQIFPWEIEAGDSSRIDITYDVLGTHAGETFPMEVKQIEKGEVVDGISGQYDVDPGIGDIFTFYLNTYPGTIPKTYRFTMQFAVPLDTWRDAWGIPQVLSSTKIAVKVTAPPAPEGIRSDLDASGNPAAITSLKPRK